ncbi:MAG: histidine phosphatase family protein [Deltaproteobacteria bacterium]|nr:histidine phosphatase family protein [Deltaproteobacteria bacterium]
MAYDPPICRRVLLMRHGHYERTGDLGDTVWGLSTLGRRQAVRVGKRLARVIDAAGGRFEGVYASPWPRATQSAEIAGREMDLDNIRIKRYLHELVPLVDPERPEFKAFPMGMEATPTESRAMVEAQVAKVRARFFKPPSRSSFVLLFAHGNLIRYLVAGTLGLPFEAWAMMDIAHASITEIRVYNNGFQALISFNDTGHLPPTMVTTA